MSRSFLIALAIGAASPALAYATCPEGTDVAAVVQNVRGEAGQIYVQRSREVQFAPVSAQPLCTGDVVFGEGEGASLEILRSAPSGREVLRSPFRRVIEAPAQGGRGLYNAWNVFWDRFLPRVQRQTYFGVVRSGGPPAWGVAGLAENAAALTPGARRLLVTWQGGLAPYRVVLSRADGTQLEALETNEAQARFGAYTFTPGEYRVQVFQPDIAEPMLSGGFSVGAPPPAMEAQPPEWASAEMRAAAQLMWLTQVDAQRWSLEALQVLDAAPAEGLDRTPFIGELAPRP